MKKAIELRYEESRASLLVLYPHNRGLFDIRTARGTCKMRGGFERYLNQYGAAARTNTLADATHDKWYYNFTKEEARAIVKKWRQRAIKAGFTRIEKWQTT